LLWVTKLPIRAGGENFTAENAEVAEIVLSWVMKLDPRQKIQGAYPEDLRYAAGK